MPATNIPGMVDFYNQKQARRPFGYGQTAPVPGPTGPATPVPTPQGPASPMGGYIDRRTQVNLGPKASQTPWAAYRPTPISPPAGAANAVPTPSQAPTVTRAPLAAPQVEYTPPPAPAAPAPVPVSAPAAQPVPQAGQPGSTLQDLGQITDAGRAYAERITRNLSGDNPLVRNAQMTEDTAASRRAYTARKNASESLAQTPFAPGSAQYQRVLTEAQAGVDMANQAGQANVNQLARAAGQDTLAAAQGLEDQQYARAVGERTNRQQQDATLGQTIEDPKARYAFQRMVASGVSPQDAYRAIVGETGTISQTYRGQSPVQQVQQDAVDWVKATQPGLAEGSPAFAAAVTARMQEVDQAQRQPVTAANRETEREDLRGILRTGGELNEAQTREAIKAGIIAPLTMSTIPAGSNVADWLKEHPEGKFSVNGEVYTLVSGSSPRTGRSKYLNRPRHTDVAEVRDSSGKTLYYYGGAFHDAPPKTVGDVEITPFGF